MPSNRTTSNKPGGTTTTASNTTAGSRTSRDARERMRAERDRQQRASRRRKAVAIGVAAVVVVGGGAAASIALAGHGGGSSSSAPVTVPAHASGTDGTVIVYGNANAKHTLDLYEDFRCPVCDALEKSDGPTIQKLADDGTYKIQYHMGTFLDANNGGSGSMDALAAAGAALDESPAKFKAFHDALYANQPAETTDGFSDTNTLLKIAAKVPDLSTPTFVKEVEDGTFKPWAQKVSDAFNSSGVTGTPTVELDGKQLTVIGDNGPITPAQYTALIQQSLGSAK